MLNRIILITTVGCEGCRIARGILRANISDDIFEEYDVNEVPSEIHDKVVLCDFPTTVFADITPEYVDIKEVLVGTFSKRKLLQLIDKLK